MNFVHTISENNEKYPSVETDIFKLKLFKNQKTGKIMKDS